MESDSASPADNKDRFLYVWWNALRADVHQNPRSLNINNLSNIGINGVFYGTVKLCIGVIKNYTDHVATHIREIDI